MTDQREDDSGANGAHEPQASAAGIASSAAIPAAGEDQPGNVTVHRGEGLEALATAPLPRHIAVVMDGNGRWAREREEPRIHGHRAGARSVRRIVELCRRRGIRYLTLFSFSTENWSRSAEEVMGLMSLFREHLESELRDGELLRNGVRLQAIGDRTRLPLAVRQLLARVERFTEKNDELHLILAVSYGGREDIVHAARRLAELVKKGALKPEEITVERLESALWTAGVPDPDLLIRTGGEMRISNFLLWQSAYTELCVVPEYWPDFTEEVFDRCLAEYAERERRFGRTSEQVRGERSGAAGNGPEHSPARPFRAR